MVAPGQTIAEVSVTGRSRRRPAGPNATGRAALRTIVPDGGPFLGQIKSGSGIGGLGGEGSGSPGRGAGSGSGFGGTGSGTGGRGVGNGSVIVITPPGGRPRIDLPSHDRVPAVRTAPSLRLGHHRPS